MPVTAITNLPDEDQPVLGNGVEDEVAVDRETAPSNYGDVRIQIRETGESSWDSNAVGFSEFIGNYDTLTMEFVGREDGEEYEVRARTETEHVDGAFTDPVAIVTKFPGATNLSVASVDSSSVTIDWTDNADNESGTYIWRRDELDPRRDTGFSSWEKIDTVGPTSGDANTVSYTDGTLEPNHDYEYYVEPFTDYTSADSATTSTTTPVAVPGEGWFIKLERPDGEIATVPHDVIDASRPTLEPEANAVGRWTFDIVPNSVLRDFIRSEAFIYYDGSLWMRGPFTRYAPSGGQGEAAARLEGLGSLKHLKSGGYEFDVTSEPGHEAFDRFVSNNLPDWIATVTAPTPKVVDSNFLVQEANTQSEFETEFGTPAASDAWGITSNDTLEPQQTCHHRDALNGSGSFSTGNASQGGSTDYVDGYAAFLSSSGDSTTVSISLPYTIPEADVGLAVRQGTDDSPGMSYYLDGNQVDWVGSSTGYLSFGWDAVGDGTLEGSGWSNGDLSGTVDVQVDCDGGGGTMAVDWIVLYDKRYHSVGNFDDATDSNDQLSGPKLYSPITIPTTLFSQEYNITDAYVDTTIDDTTGSQKLQTSNDLGATWLPDDGTETNTQSISADFDARDLYGTKVQGRVTLGPYGSRTSSTPTEGFNPQILSSWELRIDTNDLRVIDKQDYAGSAFEVLDSIADDAGLVYVPNYREDQLEVEAFQPGDVVKSVDWTVENAEPVDTTEGYYNKLTVLGPEQNDGTRLSVTARAKDEIDAVGVVEGPAAFRPDADTEEQLKGIARTLLAEGISKDTITGTLEISGQFAQPGYAYKVDAFEAIDERTDPAYVLQSASWQWGTMSLDFEGRNSLARAIRSIETVVRTTQRAV